MKVVLKPTVIDEIYERIDDAKRNHREVAHILVLRSQFEGGMTSTVRGVFCYRVNDDGLITNLRGYWNMDAMQFGQVS